MSKSIMLPESVYNLIPVQEVILEKPPRYQSKFREQVKLENQITKSPMKSFGPLSVEKPSPDNYLMKHSKEPKLPKRKPFSYGQPRKPPVPSIHERPLMGLQSNTDFVRSNVIENVMSVPPIIPLKSVDTRFGHTQLLEESGLIPKYINKQDYGQTPEYVFEIQEEARRAQEEYDRYQEEKMKESAMKQISEDERDNILFGLKTNWEKINHTYLGLSLVTDTLPKKLRKEKMETELKQLEEDIVLLEKNTPIYISNN